MSNTRESSVPTKSTYRKSFRKAGLATTVFAGIAAMALAFGARHKQPARLSPKATST